MPPKAELVRLTDVLPVAEATALQTQANQIKGIEAPPAGSLESPAQVAAASEKLILVRAVADAMEKARVKLKAPLLEKSRKVDDAFRPFLERCRNLDTSLAAEILRYKKQEQLRAERERLEADRQRRLAEAEQQKQIEAAASQAKTEAADMGLEGADADWWEKMATEGAQEAAGELPAIPEPQAPSKKIETDLGAAQVTKGPWTHEVVSVGSLPSAFYRVDAARVTAEGWVALLGGSSVPPSWRRADEDAIKAAVKCGVRSIPGVRIYQPDVLKRGR